MVTSSRATSALALMACKAPRPRWRSSVVKCSVPLRNHKHHKHKNTLYYRVFLCFMILDGTILHILYSYFGRSHFRFNVLEYTTWSNVQRNRHVSSFHSDFRLLWTTLVYCIGCIEHRDKPFCNLAASEFYQYVSGFYHPFLERRPVPRVYMHRYEACKYSRSRFSCDSGTQ
jgi:hypothetical protein